MGWRRMVYNALNRRGVRFILATAATAYASARARRPSWVFYHGAWVHRYSEGTIVEPELCLHNLSEIQEHVIDYFMHLYAPAPGDIVVDIGAGTGWETLCFSRRVGPGGRVISIEAHPPTFACLEDMCRRNRLDNVVLMNYAVADSQSEFLISDGAEHLANSIVGNKSGIPVQGATLDQIVISLDLPRVDFLKMNIEGAELMAIAGMADVIRKTRYVCICCHDFVADRSGREEVRSKATIIAFLQRNGFDVIVRKSDPRGWIRDTVYGFNRSLNKAYLLTKGAASGMRGAMKRVTVSATLTGEGG